MTSRFLRPEPLIPDELLAKLIENGRISVERDVFDPFPVVKHARRGGDVAVDGSLPRRP